MLRRNVLRGLSPLLSSSSSAACFSSSSTAAGAAPAVAVDNASTGGGFLSRLFGAGGGSRLAVPLSDPLAGVTLPTPTAPPTTKPGTEMTTLPNGVRIASEATVGPTVSLGIYIDAGSIYENPSNTGVSHLLEYMAFKSTTNRTHFRLVREVEAIGANVLASASREQMSYVIDAVGVNAPEALELLADAVLNPAFNSWEVATAVKKLDGDLKGLADNSQTTMLEALHQAAYTGSLGQPLICPPDHVGLLTADTCAQFVSQLYTAPRIVLAAAGVEHGALVSLATPLLGGLPGGPAGEPPSTYVGGDWRQYSPSPVTHAILAFEFEGGWRNVKGATAMTVLQYLMGGGGSFSAGGPGKGMHSRLYTRVLNQHAWVQNCTALTSLYNNTGLVGISGSADSGHTEQLINVMVKELQAVATKVSDEELERAKKATISSMLMNLESRAVVAEDIGRQVLTYNHRKSEAEFIAAIRALTPADITAAASRLLKTPLSMAVVGDVVNAPRYDAVARQFA